MLDGEQLPAPSPRYSHMLHGRRDSFVPSPLSCLLSLASSLLPPLSSFLSPLSCLLSLASSLFFLASSLFSLASSLLPPLSCLLSLLSCLLSLASSLFFLASFPLISCCRCCCRWLVSCCRWLATWCVTWCVTCCGTCCVIAAHVVSLRHMVCRCCTCCVVAHVVSCLVCPHGMCLLASRCSPHLAAASRTIFPSSNPPCVSVCLSRPSVMPA